MHIFDNVVWEKTKHGEHLWIDKPCDFYGNADNPNVADIARANTVADYDLLTARLAEVQKARQDDSVTNYKVRLADSNSKLRGYGAGLAIVGLYADIDLIHSSLLSCEPYLFLPHRDLGAPGDRLVWDTCAGRTMTKDESPNWFHRMLVEGLEEITFMSDGRLILPSFYGIEHLGLSNCDAQKIVRRNAEILGLKPTEELMADFVYRPPRNASTVHHIIDSGEITEKAGWGIEAKYSGLELMAYGVLNFGMHYIASAKAYDSEEFMPGKVCGREIHEINPVSSSIRVFHNGNVVRNGTVASEIERRNAIRASHDHSKDRKGLMPIPEYSASIKADLMTKQEAWPFAGDISSLKEIQFRG
ncbi:MAG: hypothetical protein PHO02_02545 [Candidatus Nanoarchaeia archaeon]|nr:hypothetical protein [Candidatus Nanoarchaeia archaeon]